MRLLRTLQASKIIVIIILRLREVRLLLLLEELSNEVVVEAGHGEIEGVLAPVFDLTQAMIIKEKVKANSIGKWDACTSTKGKARALRPTVVHFPMILVFQCMFLKERVKENVRDLVLLVLLLLQGGVGGTPLEDVTPLDAVHCLAEIVEVNL